MHKSISNLKQQSQTGSIGSKVTLKSIRRKREDFTDVNGKVLGEGSYGRVKLVMEKDTGTKFAMKIIAKSSLKSFTSINNVKREIKIQSKLSHPHIIKLIYYFENDDNVYMIMDYAPNGKNLTIFFFT
jgi:serine/threonine protein kinase